MYTPEFHPDSIVQMFALMGYECSISYECFISRPSGGLEVHVINPYIGTQSVRSDESAALLLQALTAMKLFIEHEEAFR